MSAKGLSKDRSVAGFTRAALLFAFGEDRKDEAAWYNPEAAGEVYDRIDCQPKKEIEDGKSKSSSFISL